MPLSLVLLTRLGSVSLNIREYPLPAFPSRVLASGTRNICGNVVPSYGIPERGLSLVLIVGVGPTELMLSIPRDPPT